MKYWCEHPWRSRFDNARGEVCAKCGRRTDEPYIDTAIDRFRNGKSIFTPPRELQAAITNALRATGQLDDFELAALVHAGVMKKVPSPPPQLPRGSREASGPPPGFRGTAPPPPARPSLRPSSAPPSEGSSGSRPASRRSSTPPASSAPTPDRHGPSGRSPARRRRPAPPPGTRSPTICGESGTTWSSAAGLAADRSVWSATATSPLHEPHVPRLALRVRLAAADRHQHAVAGGRLGDGGPPEGAHLARTHPRDHRVEPAALEGDLLGRGGAAGDRWRGPRPGQPPRSGLFAGGG